ncbi:MAG TPA: GAF domain-containing protein, partial [Thermoanaerobaculia bacterium]|nr:GAF domain-containing protein [Thermoanaerobaculia bacterium]
MTIHSNFPATAEPAPSRFLRARRALARLVRHGKAVDQESLRTSLAMLRAQQEATLDGTLVVDMEGRVLSYNRRFLEIWQIPADAADGADDNELLGYAAERVEDWTAFIEEVNYLYEHPAEVRSSDRVVLRDGRTLSRASMPIIVGGRVKARAWYFRDITEQLKNEKLQAALFRIAQLSRETTAEQFYPAVHEIVGQLMNATNFYIAELDEAHGVFRFPYFVDAYDESPDGAAPGRGLTGYVLRHGKPLLATPEVFEQLRAEGEVEPIGSPSIDWLGAPLKSGEKTWGVIGTQSYTEATRYTEKDREIL